MSVRLREAAKKVSSQMDRGALLWKKDNFFLDKKSDGHWARTDKRFVTYSPIPLFLPLFVAIYPNAINKI